ncbi:MAG: rhodanese-like domain-containing protein [Gammaproteobacteria bacterium]|nr:rhodanese-like domain-containing protein [Gammaproteobacteria bacterium]MDH5594156.1 rhodanese-like domain-containing protein [Gammaproteobacteria bacterium]MDH5613617.1 rhodanese-like domain-containing protein [Gammaproteobacteria bacterium]
MPDFTRFIEAETLKPHLGDANLKIIDISIPQVYKEGHIPGAVHLSYPKIVHAHDDVDCDIPPDDVLSIALSEIGLRPEHHVVIYDSQHNPMASRLCWTLEEIEHKHFSIVNGGWHGWKDTGLPVETEINIPDVSTYKVCQTGRCNATTEYIKSKLDDPNVVILDTRLDEEYTNELLITDRGGMIPGAVHLDWMVNINENDHYRLYPDDVLMENFAKIGVVPEKEIIVYCQTHFRSAHTYQVLKHLGFNHVRGYAAGYSEWGNATDTPIENEFIDDD